MKRSVLVIIVLVCLLCAVATGMAGVPQMINFQGRLTDTTGTPLDGNYSVRFRIYADSLAAIVLWEESWLTTQDNPLHVSNGIFNVLLGGVNSIPDTVFTGAYRWLGMKVEGDPEMRPLQPIVSVGYAYHSATSDTAEYARVAPGALRTSDTGWFPVSLGFHYNIWHGLGTQKLLVEVYGATSASGENAFIPQHEDSSNGYSIYGVTSSSLDIRIGVVGGGDVYVEGLGWQTFLAGYGSHMRVVVLALE